MNKKKQKQTWNNKDYKYFICDIVNWDLAENIPWNIVSGWEYEKDAKNAIKNEILFGEPNSKRLKVFSRTYLELLIP